MSEPIGTIWVCIDCYGAHHGLEPHETPDREPLSLISEGYDVTAGMLYSEHADDCPYHTMGDQAAELAIDCECEHQTFAWSACEGCGSTLGGTRDALTLWQS